MMIWTVLEVSFRRLLHNKVELLLTFVVPIAFFSIFALIFGGGVGSGAMPKIKVVLVDEVQTIASASVIRQLKDSDGLRTMHDDGAEPIKRSEAAELVRRGSLSIAVVIRKSGTKEATELGADLLTDASNQVAAQVATGLVSRAIMMSAATRPGDGAFDANQVGSDTTNIASDASANKRRGL